ncbi:hypothetical protein [Microbacterium sp. 179-I 3D4 NHS]|uniref:hypothetical protein n=1 Tax=Microbacterium sp. 179-I 3D4 NHS TaxID=3142381 RepID=UPI0039A31265
MTFAPILFAVATVAWALFLGMLVASYRSDRPARRRWALAILGPIWLVYAAVQLWREPVIEPLWLQYSLLILLPALVGFGFAVVAEHVRRSGSDPTTDSDE